ncbi:kazrin, periplakin interacting protein b isoform X2 [Conger conger]|uniref:kazrin, periplakin interacting protein b isoform X2 n=1 Tax=Conger conger TaxID=82655 RepID=UPI002A5ACD9A|nr:kazrin, periplakin interacting protein b isoform X2 [Conger conger]
MDDNGQPAECADGAGQSCSHEGAILRTHAAQRPGPGAAEVPATDLSQHNMHDPPWEEAWEEVQEELLLLNQTTDTDKSPVGGAEEVSVTKLWEQLTQRDQELCRAKEALQAMKADRKRLKMEKEDLEKQMQELYATLESREEQLRDFIRNYEQHRKESEDAVKMLAKEKDLLEREKWELKRESKEAIDCANILHSKLQLREKKSKELEAELSIAKQSLSNLTKDVPKRHSLATPTELVAPGNQEWTKQAELPLTAAIRQSQLTLCHGQAIVRNSICHSRQSSIISDTSATEGDRSSSPSDTSSPHHRTHSPCNSVEELEEQKCKKKREVLSLGSLSRVFSRVKQHRFKSCYTAICWS